MPIPLLPPHQCFGYPVWHLGKVVVTIGGKKHWLWRSVDQGGHEATGCRGRTGAKCRNQLGEACCRCSHRCVQHLFAVAAQRYDIKLPVYPVKGYSLTIPIADASRAPESTIMDETYKIVITRLGDRIRGMAEISGLFLNTGHGTLGWTMSSGSARLIPDLVSRRKPEIDATDLAISRYA